MLVSLTETKWYLLINLMLRSNCRFHAGRLIGMKYIRLHGNSFDMS